MTFFSIHRTGDDEERQIRVSPQGFDTVLGANSRLEGVLHTGGNVRLDGTFSGTLEISGNVLVGESATVEADISAHNIAVAGTIRGNLSGNKIQLLRSARVWGDITASALTTEEGAFIDGKISMVQPDEIIQEAESKNDD